MKARPPGGHDTALDCVANSLSSGARGDLYRYATTVAESMPPDSSSWFVVGAVMAATAQSLEELGSLAREARQGRKVLDSMLFLMVWLKDRTVLALLVASGTVLSLVVIAISVWHFAYNTGYDAKRYDVYFFAKAQTCQSLQNVRHNLALTHGPQPALEELQHEFKSRGC